MIDYTTRIDGDVTQICFIDPENGNYMEIPVPLKSTQESIEVKLTEFLVHLKDMNFFEEIMSEDFTLNFKDTVYMNGSVVRIDYSSDRPEALDLINGLINVFPQYNIETIRENAKNVIGNYGNYRPPYNNSSVSLYVFETPSEEVLETYGCDVDTYGENLNNWYGLKNDLSSQEVSAKFVFKNYSGPNKPQNLPSEKSHFYAAIHKTDGSKSPWLDVYTVTPPEPMREWCIANNCQYPLPESESKKPWCFSVVFNEDTGEINCVKAYIRHRYADA